MTLASKETSSTLAELGRQRFVVYDAEWEAFESLLQAFGDQRIFITFNQGTLELMSPSPEHERISTLLARIVYIYTEVLRLAMLSFGSSTLKLRTAARGLQADQCFYITNAARMRGKRKIDLAVDPPPDLAIEVDLENSSAGKESVYSGLGVPELWRYEDGEVIVMVRSSNGSYLNAATSVVLPLLNASDLTRFVERGLDLDETDFSFEVRAWLESTRLR